MIVKLKRTPSANFAACQLKPLPPLKQVADVGTVRTFSSHLLFTSSPPRRINTTGASQPQLAGYYYNSQAANRRGDNHGIQRISCRLLSQTCTLAPFACFVRLLCESSGTISRWSLGGRLRARDGRLQTRVARLLDGRCQ